MSPTDVTTQIAQLIERFDAERAATIDELQTRTESLEAENEKLRAELAKSQAGRFTVQDEELRKRLSRLGDAPTDTVIRESGVILENRIRRVMDDSGKNAFGVRLVDLAFKPGSGAFIVSEHGGEQEGIHMLYRGAMQFIRNPPMHKLIEYQETTVTLFVTLIDSLLCLLDEVTTTEDNSANSEKAKSTYWSVGRLQKALPQHKDHLLGNRLEELLEWALTKHLFMPSKASAPIFGIKGRMGKRVLNIFSHGGLFFYLYPSRYEDEVARQTAFTFYQSLGLLTPHLTIAEVDTGRFSHRSLRDLNDDEWATFKDFLESAFG